MKKTRYNGKVLFPVILTVIPIVLFLMKISGGHLAGSETDWLSQHCVFPEYFRQKFYETGNLWPDFAMELGGGQNIWNFAYYGLYNPLYLLSFLLPFVKMTDYIQAVMLLTWIADGLLCYVWLKNGHFRREDSFFAACMLILAGPVVYHTSMQIMFVSYLPFLLLTLAGYDRYCSKGKYGLLTAGVFFMVLTSFYFAVGGVAALLLYGLCGWKKEWASSLPVLIKNLWKQFYPAFFGGLLSFFYLVPVCLAMMGGRSGEKSYALSDLLTPNVAIWKMFYTPYGMGLTVMSAVILCVSLFYCRCREKYMAVGLSIMLLFPVVSYILNGGLYMREKVFIPFLPLMCYLAAAFFGYFRRGIIARRKLASGYALAAFAVIWGSLQEGIGDRVKVMLYIDLLLCAGLLFAGIKLWRRALCTGLAALMFCGGCFQVFAARQTLVEAEWMEEFERMEMRGTREQEKAADNQVLTKGQNITTVYSSVDNSAYEEFRENILHLSRPARNGLMQESSDNPAFLRMMGVKYLLVRSGSGASIPEGYEKTGQAGDVEIYENADVLPVGYVTDQVISTESLSEYSWPERSMALLSYAAAGDEDTVDFQPQIREADFRTLEGDYEISSGGKRMDYILDGRQDGDRYLFLSFKVKNNHPYQDVSVSVDKETNKQSASRGYAYNNKNKIFYYMCPLEEGQSSVEIEFGEGNYEITDVQAWYGTDEPDTSSSDQVVDAGLKLTKDGDGMTGRYTAENDGWLITSIPYDEHFTVLIDGEKADIEEVNGGFLGAEASSGTHTVRIFYNAPGKNAGIAVSAAAAFLLAADVLRRKYRTECKKGKTCQ